MTNARCLLQEIDLSSYGLGKIVPLSVGEIVELDNIKISEELTKFNELLIPFTVEDKIIDTSKMFNLVFLEDEQVQTILIMLMDALKILYRTDEIKIDYDKLNNVNISISEAIINQSNFKTLRDLVREMFFISKQEDVKERVFQISEENKSILEEYLRLEQQHKQEMEKLNKKNQKSLHQIITIVASQCLWDYDKVLSMSYYRLINTYISIFKIDGYTTYMQYATSGQFDMKNQSQKTLD